MTTLHDRLAELADEAPTGGAPAAELWARGRRAHRLRAAALGATLLVVGVAAAGVGVRLADGGADRSRPEPAGPVGVKLPIDYPVGAALPDLGDAPGPLTAVWLASRGGGELEAVGLLAETGSFGTLPIDLPVDNPPADVVGVALSADGRRLAYNAATGELTVRDLATGVDEVPLTEFGTRVGFVWVDATHLFGYVAGGGDVDAWLWQPGTAAKRINLLTYDGDPDITSHGVGRDVRVADQGGGPRSCSAPTLENNTPTFEHPDRWEVPELCDVLAILESAVLVGHGNPDRLSGDWNGPGDGNGMVVALSLRGAPMAFNGRAVPPVVVTAGAPERVTFAVDLISDLVLDADGGAS